MESRRPLHAFAVALEDLLGAPDVPSFEATWDHTELQALGGEALAEARRDAPPGLGGVLARIDRLLLALLERARASSDAHVMTFRVPQLERWQHATAAAVVGVRWGVAGLRTVIGDGAAPLGRRYFAFLALAERHPQQSWPLFEKYLATPGAHHAFLGAAVEAARFYPGSAATLVRLFERIRGDHMLRRFLAPKILESLYVLGDPAGLPLFEHLLVAGHTDRDPDRCEVTRALVAVRKFTGHIPASAKYADPDDPAVSRALDAAEQRFEAERDRLNAVTVI